MLVICNSGSKLLPIFVIILVVTNSCVKDNLHPVPYVPIDFMINTESTQHIELNSPGGWAYYTGGFRGVIIYRYSVDEFRAYDRACPIHPLEDCAIIRVTDYPLASCECCNSTFSIIDGSPVPNHERHPLKEYRTFYNNPWLRVYN